MKYMAILILIFSVIGTSIYSSSGETAPETGAIEVVIKNVNPDEHGPLLVYLYDGKSWNKPEKTSSLQFLEISVTGEAEYTAVFKTIPFGEYGVQVVHDEDMNGKLTLGILGPKEGVGVSSYIPSFIPKFKKAKFSHNKEKTSIEVMLNY